MTKFNNNKIIGIVAGIVSGIAYGTNPLFARPLMDMGISTTSVLFFRYLFGMICMALLILVRRESFKVTRRQIPVLVQLGIYFSGSSAFLFFAYNYIPSGIATTLGYMSPIFIAISMAFIKQYPSWQTWLSIAITMAGVAILCIPSGKFSLNALGITLSILSAMSYAIYLIIVNRSVRLKDLSPDVFTFYALGLGSIIFAILALASGNPLLEGVHGFRVWALFTGLGIVPTTISLLTLAISIRLIGATTTSILGVLEPITAMMIGIVLFREPLTISIAIGTLLCVSAVAFLIVSENKN